MRPSTLSATPLPAPAVPGREGQVPPSLRFPAPAAAVGQRRALPARPAAPCPPRALALDAPRGTLRDRPPPPPNPPSLEPPLPSWTLRPAPNQRAGKQRAPPGCLLAVSPGRGSRSCLSPLPSGGPGRRRCPRSRLSQRQHHRRGKGINIFCSTSHQKRLIRTCNFSGNITVKCHGAVGRQPREGGQISPQAQGEASLSIY